MRRALWATAVAGQLMVLAFGTDGAEGGTLQTSCTGTAGDAVSLVTALGLANGDTVVLKPGCTYTLSAADNNWFGPNGLPPIKSDVVIEGNGATIARSG